LNIHKIAIGLNEGNPQWQDLPRTQAMLNAITSRAVFCVLLPLLLTSILCEALMAV